MALLKLLQHGVATNDARLQEITVKARRFTYDIQRVRMGLYKSRWDSEN